MEPRGCWPYSATPIGLYLAVMGPICALEAFLLLNPTPAWMRWSAGAVVAITLIGLYRGYARRLVLSSHGATMKTLWLERSLDWTDVRHVGVCRPPAGIVSGATTIYITRRDRPPEFPWQQDEATIQVQYRPGLLEAIKSARRSATSL